MINNNKEKLQSVKDQIDKQFNVAINQVKNTEILELLNDNVIMRMDEVITPFYEMAKKLKELLQKMIYVTDVLSQVGKLNQLKAIADAKDKNKSDMTI